MGEEAEAIPLVFVCTEDVDFYLLLDHILEAESIATCLGATLEEIRTLAGARRPDAVVLDCRALAVSAAGKRTPLRREGWLLDIPLIALIDQGEERTLVDLVKTGIHEVFIRPVLPAKLVSSLRSILVGRRAAAEKAPATADAVYYADLEMDLATYRVRRQGRDIHLSPIEFRILRRLLQHPEQVVTREELKTAAWQDRVHVEPRTVDVHVGKLRRALLAVSDKDLIRTVRSVGYALADGSAADPAAPE